LLIGGASTKRQLEKLKKKPQIIVGSLGRISELIQNKKLKVPMVGMVVVDEADQMLKAESLTRLKRFVASLSSAPQFVFVSATVDAQSWSAAQKMVPEMEQICVAENRVNSSIEHIFFKIEERSKADLLRRLIRAVEPERALVFVHRNKDAELVKSKMEYYGIAVADIHGTHDKLVRKKALDDIRSGKVSLLIASDVAARGLDIKGVTHIFNYDIPSSSKDYLHRVGRTGRAGAEGFAVSLMTEQEARLAKRYEKELGIEMVEAFMREGEIFAVEEAGE
jgi:superfamily II DNA/RNA helicase